MLGDHAHLDKAQLAYITDIEWRETTDPDTAAALSKHFNSLLEYEGALREIEPSRPPCPASPTAPMREEWSRASTTSRAWGRRTTTWPPASGPT